MPPITKCDKALFALIKSWEDDKSGYDERAWPILQKAIEENRLSSRKRFSEPSPHSLTHEESTGFAAST